MNNRLICFLILVLTSLAAAGQDYVAPEVKVSADKVRVDGRTFYAHVVMERQTLYSISRAYQVTIQDIYDANPKLELPTQGVKKGQVLLIPLHSAHVEKPAPEPQAVPDPQPQSPRSDQEVPQPQVSPEAHEAAPDTSIRKEALFPQFLKYLGLKKSDRDSSDFVVDMPEVIRVALLLPFRTAAQADANSLDFYAGALLAARDLGEQGLRLHLDAIDITDGKTQPGAELLAASDVIIGPVGVDDLSRMAAVLPERKFLISPLEPKAAQLCAEYPVIQTPTPARTQCEEAVRWAIEDSAPGDSLFLIRQSSGPLSESSAQIIAALNASGRHYTTISYDLLQGRQIQSTFVYKASRTGTNRYLIASEDESFVNDAVRNINLMAYKKHEVALYAPSRLRNFSTLETENLHNVHTHLAAAYFADYDNPEVRRFVMAYRALYQVEPNSFAFHGYDTFRYFVSLCQRYGRMWAYKLSEFPQQGLQTDFLFPEESQETGCINKAVRHIVYEPDFKVRVTPARLPELPE